MYSTRFFSRPILYFQFSNLPPPLIFFLLYLFYPIFLKHSPNKDVLYLIAWYRKKVLPGLRLGLWSGSGPAPRPGSGPAGPRPWTPSPKNVEDSYLLSSLLLITDGHKTFFSGIFVQLIYHYLLHRCSNGDFRLKCNSKIAFEYLL